MRFKTNESINASHYHWNTRPQPTRSCPNGRGARDRRIIYFLELASPNDVIRGARLANPLTLRLQRGVMATNATGRVRGHDNTPYITNNNNKLLAKVGKIKSTRISGPKTCATSLEIRYIVLNVPYFSCTTADFAIQYFINKVTFGVSARLKLIFSD